MGSDMLVTIMGGVLTIVNTIIGIAITNLFRAHSLVQTTLNQNQSDIRVTSVHLGHLAQTLKEHTDSDRAEFKEMREQSQEQHLANISALQDLRGAIRRFSRPADQTSAQEDP